MLEHVQRCATKYVTTPPPPPTNQDNLKLLPLMYIYKLNDLIIFIISNYVYKYP